MNTRVCIQDGNLVTPAYRGDFVYFYHFQAYLENGAPMTGDWTGEGHHFTKDGTAYVNVIDGLHVRTIRIADAPTPESTELTEGYFHGMAQKRKVPPKNKSERFVDGWRDAWSEKRPFTM